MEALLCFIFFYFLLLEVMRRLKWVEYLWEDNKELLREKGEGEGRLTFLCAPLFCIFTFPTMSMDYLLQITFIQKVKYFIFNFYC